MFRLPHTRHVIAAAALFSVSLFGGQPATVNACEPYRCVWKAVTIYEKVEQPVVSWVLQYDRYGNPYHVKVVSHETVQAPVVKRVKVCY